MAFEWPYRSMFSRSAPNVSWSAHSGRASIRRLSSSRLTRQIADDLWLIEY
jgi:hypothetical protein